MDYIKESKRFITGHYLGSGVRITLGVLLPAVVLNYCQLLGPGIIVSLGALCTSIPDTPGDTASRRNAMLTCMAVIFVVAILSGFASSHPILLGFLIVILCFILAIIGVFGARANAIGIAGLLVMVLNIDRPLPVNQIIVNAVLILAGGAWYTVWSLVLQSIRPYRLPQQALGDCILATSTYLRVRASFYDEKVDYDHTYQQMLTTQIDVQEKQNLVRELLFKSRKIVQESTNTGRILVMMFIDIVDLFERAITSYQDYKSLHDYFAGTDILSYFRDFILSICSELDEIGIAVQSGNASVNSNQLREELDTLQHRFAVFRDQYRTPQNIEGFISLRQILNSFEDIVSRVNTLHSLTTYDKTLSKKLPSDLEYKKFITYERFDIGLIVDNLTYKSNNFRHAVRLSIATLAGYLLSQFLSLGHSYWILLTIIVILKPAYSLTKKRNYQRLLGTLAGACIGFIILYFLKDNTVIFVFMLLLMIGSYTFIRTNYLISVILMTPYVLLLYHLISKTNFQTVFVDRVTDTIIGSAIAFLANFALVPSWEQEKIKSYMMRAVADNLEYFKNVSSPFTGGAFIETDYKLTRKNAFVALANLSDAFNRMLSEPKSKQKNPRLVHQFVVLNHMLTSHIASLSSYVKPLAEKYRSANFVPVIDNTTAHLEAAKGIISGERLQELTVEPAEKYIPEKQAKELLQKRREELQRGLNETETKTILSEFKSIVDQFDFIATISSDLRKLSVRMEQSEKAAL